MLYRYCQYCIDCDILKSYGHNYQNSCDLYLVEYKNLKIQVKIRTPRYREWRVSSRLSKNKDFNILYILCMNKHLENIEKAYARGVFERKE